MAHGPTVAESHLTLPGVVVGIGHNEIRNQLIADSADENDEGIVFSLPSRSQADFLLPKGFRTSGDLKATKAALKAAGFGGLDSQFGASDAEITFNSVFPFDYNNSDSDSVAPGTMDFETVAAHEIGHALGFVSQVDAVDWYAASGGRARISPSVLDLYRFEEDTQYDPESAADFATFPRSLVPGVETVMDQIASKGAAAAENRMSTGAYTGDGRQASHWKDGDLTGQIVGILDPTLAYGQIISVAAADLRALDLMGYDIVFEADGNNPPVAQDDEAKINKKTGLASGNVLDNDADPDGGSLAALLVTDPSTAAWFSI